MNKKELIYQTILQLNYQNGIDASTLASIMNMSRSNVSYELNKLYKEGKLHKTNGRPVLFLIPENNELNKEPHLDIFARNNISLRHAVEQAKSAILYPPKGMNSLILGETGVGKSMFASLMHNYALEMNVKSKESPFIVFNCADYSNNPQLLTSQLFGVKKGAYTGAETDKVGLIEQANGGILFLDEVHRLPPEGQEALFIFLDTGTFRRFGDSELRTSDVLIISATTEDPNSALLNTFTRRIPMTITIPSLKDRTLEERLYLIKSFFKYESNRLNKEIYVSLNCLRSLLSYDCPSNIGQLKSDVQLLCAKAYSEFLTKKSIDVRITSRILPSYVREGLYKEKEHRFLWNNLIGEEIEFFKFSDSNEDVDKLFKTEEQNSIYNFLEDRMEKLKVKYSSEIDIENILEKDIAKHFSKNAPGVPKEINKKNLLTIINEDVLNCIDKMVDFYKQELDIVFDNNLYTAFALHINTLITRVRNGNNVSNTNIYNIKNLYPKEFNAAFESRKILEDYLYTSISIEEAGYLALFLIPENAFSDESLDKVKIILIAHGESTATSMADVANRLLGEDYVIAINAPIEIAPLEVLEDLKIAVKNNPSKAGYLLLVDMGSLTTFAEVIHKEFNVPIKVISLISTLHVLEATRKALAGTTLDNIYNDVLMISSYVGTYRNINESNIAKNKVLIITACLTGEGAAIAIKNFLNTNLNYNENLFEIVCLNCLDRNYFKQKILNLQDNHEILFVVSSFTVDLNIKQYTLAEVFNMNIIKELQDSINYKTAMLNIPTVINENIQNVDGNELFNDVTTLLNKAQSKLSIKLSNEKTVGVTLHLAFLVGRLMNGDSAAEYEDKNEFISKNNKLYNIIKEEFSSLNNKYNIEISDDEICYLINLFISN